jgi:hypothetical protein
MKQCPKCSQTKASSEFYVRKWKRADGSPATGLARWCKPCSISDHKTNYTKKLSEGDPWKFAGELVNRMKDRTKKGGYLEEVEFTKEEVFEIISSGTCAQTGIPFRIGTTGTNTKKNPFNPSPDRIDNSKGYTKSNVQWVVFIYNAMRNNFEDKDVSTFINSLKERT